jgi:hypothetical protein
VVHALYGKRQRTAGRSTCAGLLRTRSRSKRSCPDHIGKTSTAFDNTAVGWPSSGKAAFVAASERRTQSRSNSQRAVHRQVGRPLDATATYSAMGSAASRNCPFSGDEHGGQSRHRAWLGAEWLALGCGCSLDMDSPSGQRSAFAVTCGLRRPTWHKIGPSHFALSIVRRSRAIPGQTMRCCRPSTSGVSGELDRDCFAVSGDLQSRRFDASGGCLLA